MPSASNPVIELTEVDVPSGQDYSVMWLVGVTWRINAGEYWVVRGAPGSGKSDLLFTAAAMQRPLSGNVRLFATDTATLSESELLRLRLRIGLVFKRGGRMFPHLTVRENLTLPLHYHFHYSTEEASELVQPILEATGLTRYANNTAGVLGANWQQRVGLARALALKPEVLLLDEPLTGLEPRDRTWWLEFLEGLSHGMPVTEGKPLTLVTSTNELEPWGDVACQFAAIKDKHLHSLGDHTQWRSSVQKLGIENEAEPPGTR